MFADPGWVVCLNCFLKPGQKESPVFIVHLQSWCNTHSYSLDALGHSWSDDTPHDNSPDNTCTPDNPSDNNFPDNSPDKTSDDSPD